MNHSPTAIAPLLNSDFYTHATILGTLVTLAWVVEGVDRFLFKGRLDGLGIRPQSMLGLRGILFAPLLHGSFKHLATNTLPFLVLGWLILLRGVDEFAIVSVVAMLISGLGVWLFAARRSVHVGASGVIFGYFGFLLLRSYFDRNALSAIFSVLVVLLYGPLIWGVLPSRRGISWQGHLFGFIGGAIAARYLPEVKQWLAAIVG